MERNVLIVNYGDNPFKMSYELMEKLDIKSMLNSDAKIAIKPNLVVAKPASTGATTTPEVVEGIIVYLKDNGFKNITIMESSWVGDSTRKAFQVCGYTDISKKYQVPLIDLKEDQSVTLEHNGMSMKICKSALEADFLINVPVLKGHCQTMMTCALKNLKGCIPDSEKRRFHALGLYKPIAVLNKLLKSSLIIVDCIMGDLTFEEGGTPVRMDRLIAGFNPVLVDSYAATLMGYRPEDIGYIVEAEKLGLGSIKLSDLCLLEINKENKLISKASPNKRISHLTKYIDEKNACSACYGSLIHALNRMYEEGTLNKVRDKFAIGQGFRNTKADGIGVGNCTKGFTTCISGCPPRAVDILKAIK